MTPADVEAFQAEHCNHLGQPLLVDGIPGPQTRWARDFQTICAARRNIVVTAQGFIGLTEDPIGSNSDPAGLILSWLKLCGARLGDPWCAAFGSRCLGTVRIAGAQALGKHFPATTTPMPGDGVWYPTNDWHGHFEIFIGGSPTEVMTIGGNVDNAVKCVRRPRLGLRFCRTVADVSGVCPGVVPSVHVQRGGGTR